MFTYAYYNKAWSVYFIRNASGKSYIGISSNVEKRFKHHQEGDETSLPILGNTDGLELVAVRPCGHYLLASTFEAWLHSLHPESALRYIQDDKFIDIFEEQLASFVPRTEQQIKFISEFVDLYM